MILLASVCCFIGCSERERTNPFDPLSDLSMNRTVDLELTSTETEIIATWNPLYKFDFETIHLDKYKMDDSLLATYIFTKFATKFRDSNIEYDKSYRYLLKLRLSGYETPEIASDVIVPGPGYLWVLDSYLNYVTLLSYDGEHIYRTFENLMFPYLMSEVDDTTMVVVDYIYNGFIFLTPHSEPVRLQTDLGFVRDFVYSSETNNIYTYEMPNKIRVYDHLGNELPGFELNSSGVEWMDMDDANSTLWFGSDSNGVCTLNLTNGSVSKVSNDRTETGMFTDHKGYCVVCSRAEESVKIYNRQRELEFSTSIEGPISLAYDRVRDYLWIGSDGDLALKRISLSSFHELSIDYEHIDYPANLAVNERRGELFVADPSLNKVLHFDENGSKLGELESDVMKYPSRLKFSIIQ